MNEVSVTSEMINNGISICRLSIDKLRELSAYLQNIMENAYAYGWHDENRVKIERIVNDCIFALEKPFRELETCDSKLHDLLNAVAEYEDSVN